MARGRFEFRTIAKGAALGVVGFVAAAAPALAQPSAGDVMPPDGQIEDIVVTAQRRAESLQRVPISVQVIKDQVFIEQNLTSVVALGRITPSIHVQGSGRSSNFYIRGTGSGESQSFDQSVVTFIDDVYHGRSRYSEATFLDIEHLEILKGPQSTFFGNNAIAGAFNIVTKKPGRETEGWVRGLLSPTGGEHGGQYVAEGAFTAPINEDWSVRLAGTANGMRGYMRNSFTGEHAPNKDNAAVRATLRYAPDENLDVTLKAELGRNINKGGLVLRSTYCPPVAPFTARGFCAINVAAGNIKDFEGKEYVANEGNQARMHTYDTVLTAAYTVDENTITSVTAYSGYRYKLELDNDGTTQHLLNVQAPEKYRQFSQELRIASPTDRPVEYLAGVYFQADRLKIEQSVSYFFLTPNFSAPASLAPLRPYLPLGQKVNAQVDERVYSGFGSLVFNVDENLKFIGGLRGSIVTKDFDWGLVFGTASANYGGINPLPSNIVPIANALGLGTSSTVSLDRNDSALMPSATAQYQFTPDVMAYASYSRGFKAGGFSVAELSAIAANYGFNPEHVNAYEIGFKSELANRTVMLNASLFRNDFSNLQVSIQGTSATGALINFVRNAAASRAQGAELEGQWVLSPNFKLAASGMYLESEFRSYPNAAPTYAQQLAGLTRQDLSGRPTLYAPRWSGTLTGTLTFPVASDYELIMEATGIFSSKYYTYSTLDPFGIQPGYGRLDARISLESADGVWAADIIGKNLTDTLVRTFTGQQPTSLGSFYQDREQFRNIAFQLRYKF